MILRYVLTHGEDRYEFNFVAHRTTAVKKRIFRAAFYKSYSPLKRVPRGIHFEVEIIDPKPWSSAPEHVHVYSEPGWERVFICYTSPLPSLDAVHAMLEVWCVGTVYTLITGKDFVPEKSKHPQSFLERMREEHGITLI